VSFAAIKWALEVSAGGEIPPAAFAVLMVLADHHNPEHGCFPSQETLIKRVGLSPRHIRNQLRWLEKRGLIKVKARGRRNHYVLNIGTPVPVSPENIFINSGTPVPVYCGTPVPVLGENDPDTGTPVPLELTSNLRIKRISKGKATTSFGVAAQVSSEGEPSHEENEEETTLKVKDAIAASEIPESEAEVMKIFSDHKAKSKMVTGGMVGRVWTKLHALYQPTVHLTALSQKQKGQLAKAYAFGGDEFIKALPLVIEHWQDFLTYLHNIYGTTFKKFHPIPDIGVVLQEVQPVIQFAHDGPAKMGLTKQKAVKKVAPKVPLQNEFLTKPNPYSQNAKKLTPAEKAEALALGAEVLKGK